MRLDPAEVPHLPLPAALLTRNGEVLCSTPQWRGATPGSVTYSNGQTALVVAGDVVMPDLEDLMQMLLDSLHEAGRALGSPTEECMRMLATGLELVAGHPIAISPEHADSDEIVRLLSAALAARGQTLSSNSVLPNPPIPIRSPEVVAFALMQFARNARKHEGVESVRLRIESGPVFYLEWPSDNAEGVQVTTHRNQARAKRWGWHYIQMAADALGASALPPGQTEEGWRGCAISLRGTGLTLPMAVVEGGRVLRCTKTWDQNPELPTLGQSIGNNLGELCQEALQRPEQVIYGDLYRARSIGARIYLVLVPEAGSSRAEDVLRGMAHESTLWKAPEPFRTRLDALVDLLGVALGRRWPEVPGDIWAEFGQACQTLGVPPQPPIDPLVWPHPRLTAFLLATLGGQLEQDGDRVFLRYSPESLDNPIVHLFDINAVGRFQITST